MFIYLAGHKAHLCSEPCWSILFSVSSKFQFSNIRAALLLWCAVTRSVYLSWPWNFYLFNLWLKILTHKLLTLRCRKLDGFAGLIQLYCPMNFLPDKAVLRCSSCHSLDVFLHIWPQFRPLLWLRRTSVRRRNLCF